MSNFNFQISGHDVSVRQRNEGEGCGVDIIIDGRFPPISILIGRDSFRVLADGHNWGQPIPLKLHDHHELWVQGHDHGKAEAFDVGLLFDAVRKLEHDVAEINHRLAR